MILSGCSKEDLIQESAMNTSKSKSNVNQMMSVVNSKFNLLGFGYDITGEFANASAAKFSVIDVQKLENDYSTRVLITPMNATIGKITAGINARNYTEGLQLRVDATYSSVPGFKGTITARYNDSTAFSSKFVYSSFDHQIQHNSIKLNASYELLKSYLTPSFLDDVQNQSAAFIVANYGTHILKDIIIGAKLEVLYRSETTKEDRILAASAGVDVSVKSIFNISTGYSYNSTQTADNFSHSLHYRTWGGDPSIHIVGEVPTGSTAPVISIANWKNSSTVENSVLININEGGLIPIYEVISDPAKKAALQSYISQYLSDNQIRIINEPPTKQIYRCYNPRTNGHLLTANPGEVAGLANWYVEGPFAKMFPDNSITGTVAVHRFYIFSTNTHLYSTNRNELSPDRGRYEGILGYVFSSNTRGTLPLIRYLNTKGIHMFSIGYGELGWGKDGWQYEGILGYI